MSHLLDCNEVDLLGYLTNHCCNKIEIHCLVSSTRFKKWVGLGFFSTLSNVNWLWLVSAVSYSFQLANQPWLLFFFCTVGTLINGGGGKKPNREESLWVHCMSVSTGLYMLVSVICQRRKCVDHKNLTFLLLL